MENRRRDWTLTLADSDIAAVQPEVSRIAAPRGGGRLVLFGFEWADGALLVRKTGVRLQVGFPLIWEISHWAFYLPVLAVVAAVARMRRSRAPFNIWYAPDRPGPWYLLRGAALWAGFGAAQTPDQADAAIFFDDTTQGRAPAGGPLRLINGACTDISKSHVAEVFEAVFGYPLRLDPCRCTGAIVEKAEKNGVHDGGVVIAPLRPREGYVYQRLIDTTGPDGMVHDLRTPCVGGAPVVVWEKTKPVRLRFTIHNSRAVLRDPTTVYSAEELERIGAFTDRMGLDWGGLDILRDRKDGRIYIVDVNKTDLGPVIALGWSDKLRSMHRLATALSKLVEPNATLHGDGQKTCAQAPYVPEWKVLAAPLAPIAVALALGLVWVLLHPQTAALDLLARYADSLRAAAIAHPALSLVLFTLAYAATVSLMLPVGLILIFAGGYVLGPLVGAVGSMAGATLGAVTSYGMARLAPGPAIRQWTTRFPRLETLRAAFVSHPFRYTFSMRLMPLTPFTLISFAAGLNRIGLAPFALGTLLGVAPECALYATVGAGLSHGFTLNDGMLSHPLFWVGLAMVAILLIGSQSRLDKPSTASSPSSR